MLTIYKVKQKGIIPFLIRFFYTIRFFKKCEYNHVMVGYKHKFYELDVSVKGVNSFHKSLLNDDWEIKEYKSYKAHNFHSGLDMNYSNIANLRYVCISIPIIGRFIKKLWKPNRKNTNCCGYIASVTENDRYFDLHPNDFK